ncbi:lysine exporter protein precursor [Vibrio ishigakensis]|uniref:Lysine exporter protein n=1 Tax=Vibrio ishigakensis TaxID=1481914 RepID=A0A0B8P5U0_9VIBR|nr:lysine exporter protein precursor [Vibrio ishigakensis]
MTVSIWLSLLGICILGAMSPGPSLAVVTKHTLSSGRLHGLTTAWSHSLGIGAYALATLYGLALLIEKSPQVFEIITYLGAAYLAYLGFKALTSKGGILAAIQSGSKSSLKQAASEA